MPKKTASNRVLPTSGCDIEPFRKFATVLEAAGADPCVRVAGQLQPIVGATDVQLWQAVRQALRSQVPTPVLLAPTRVRWLGVWLERAGEVKWNGHNPARDCADAVVQRMTDTGWPAALRLSSPWAAILLWRCDLPAESPLPEAVRQRLSHESHDGRVDWQPWLDQFPQSLPFVGLRYGSVKQRGVWTVDAVPEVLVPVDEEAVLTFVEWSQEQSRAVLPSSLQPLVAEGHALTLVDRHRDGTRAYRCHPCPCGGAKSDVGATVWLCADGEVGLGCGCADGAYSVLRGSAAEHWLTWCKRRGELAQAVVWGADGGETAPESTQYHEFEPFIAGWRARYKVKVCAAQLAKLADAYPSMREVMGTGNSRSRCLELSARLRELANEVIGGVRIRHLNGGCGHKYYFWLKPAV